MAGYIHPRHHCAIASLVHRLFSSRVDKAVTSKARRTGSGGANGAAGEGGDSGGDPEEGKSEGEEAEGEGEDDAAEMAIDSILDARLNARTGRIAASVGIFERSFICV